jgi:DNA-binding NtrC family response regulator
MSDAKNEIKVRVEAFVDELSALVRRAALEAVEQALGSKGVEATAPARKPGRPRKVAAAPAPVVEEKKAPGRPRGRPAKSASAAAASAAAAAKRRAGEKRSPALLAQVTEQVFNHVKSNAGQGVEQIAKALGTSTKELTLPIRKLLADKKITSKGQKRATRYFPK